MPVLRIAKDRAETESASNRVEQKDGLPGTFLLRSEFWIRMLRLSKVCG